MDNSNLSKNRPNELLGVNKLGKNIRKSPLHQPNFGNSNRQQTQPQVYNISKNDFRNIVQQLTGSPSQEPQPVPPHNPSRPPSMRLQRIRPPPLTPINRPPNPTIPGPGPGPIPAQPPPPYVPYNSNNNSNTFVRPPPQVGHPLPSQMPPYFPGDSAWPNTAESPISAYMRYLQTDSTPKQAQGLPQVMAHPQSQYVAAQPQHQPPSSAGLLPNPRGNGPPLLPSPTSQFLLSSPSSFLNLLSPRSPYPLLSPGFQFPSPITPNFSFSPMAQSGILGPGPQFPPSPGIAFPLSPSGLFPVASPRWRDQ